jgi:hypothetical protein
MKRRVPSIGTGRAAVCPDRGKLEKTTGNQDGKTGKEAMKESAGPPEAT